MESVLKQLETRIEELVASYREAVARSTELEAKVGECSTEIDELRAQLAANASANDRVEILEKERNELAARLQKVLGLIDGVLGEGRPST